LLAKKRRKSGRSYVRPDGRGIIYTWHIGEAADRLGITVATTRQRIRKGNLKGFKAGGEWYVVVRHPYRRRRRSSTQPQYSLW